MPGIEATGHNKKEKKTNSNECWKINMFSFSERSDYRSKKEEDYVTDVVIIEKGGR